MLLKWLIFAVSTGGKSRFPRFSPKKFLTSTTGHTDKCTVVSGPTAW